MTQTQTQKKNPSPSLVPMTDPRYPIWGRQWKSRAPRIAAYSTSYLQNVGIPSSGYADVDLGQMTKLDVVYLTINQMVEYYHSSVEVRIVNKEDVKSIFEACQDYTFRAAKLIRNGEMPHMLPLADLIKIDEFAAAVYEHAGHEYGHDKEYIRTFMSEDLMKQALEIHTAFDSVDKHMKARKNKKRDHYTVFTELSGELRKNNQHREEQKAKFELPERPSVRDIFESVMSGSYGGERI